VGEGKREGEKRRGEAAAQDCFKCHR
jgi:hypothetical protein